MVKNNIKIGGDFGINISDLELDISEKDKFRNNTNYYFLDTGRSAIYVALMEIKDRTKIENAWVPYFICETAIQPFKDLGFKINYYSMGSNLKSPNGLPSNLSDSVFLFVHYFGRTNYEIIN